LNAISGGVLGEELCFFIKRKCVMGTDIRKYLTEILADKTERDVLLVNVPSHFYKKKSGLFDLPFLHIEKSSKNTGRLYGDQNYEPNHGLLLICSALKESQIKFKLLDLHSISYLNSQGLVNVDIDSLLHEFVKAVRPKVIGFSCMSPNLWLAKKFAKKAKELYRNIITVIGGLSTTNVVDCFESEIFDYAILSEGEYSFVKLCDKLINNLSDISSIENIAYRRSEGIYKNYSHELRGQGDLVPAYELLPKELELIPRVFASRGCGSKCDFCSPRIFFNSQLLMRKAINIISEIKYLHENFNFRWFNIGDLTLYLNDIQVQEVCRFLSKGDFKPWWCQTQAAKLTDETIELLGESGCLQVAIGFEDFFIENKRIKAKNLGKAQSITICNKLHKYGIMVQGYWMFGMPEETFESSLLKIENMCEFVRYGYIDTIHISYLIPYMNTAYRNECDILNITHDDYSRYMDLSCCFYNELPMHSTKNLTDKEIYLLMQLAISSCANEFYNRGGEL